MSGSIYLNGRLDRAHDHKPWVYEQSSVSNGNDARGRRRARFATKGEAEFFRAAGGFATSKPNTTVQRWGHPGKYKFPNAALGKNDKDDIGSRAHWRNGGMTSGRHRREMEEKGLAGNLEGEYSTSADSLKKIGSDIFMEGLRARRRRAAGERGARGHCVVGNAKHFTEEVVAFANRVNVDIEVK